MGLPPPTFLDQFCFGSRTLRLLFVLVDTLIYVLWFICLILVNFAVLFGFLRLSFSDLPCHICLILVNFAQVLLHFDDHPEFLDKMDREIQHAFSRMGIQDPSETASLDAAFAALERSINDLLDDGPVPTPQCSQSTLSPVQVNRYDYVSKIYVAVMQAKFRFQNLYHSLQRQVESLSEQIRRSANAREEELKQQLWCIKAEKTSQWNRQLEICDSVLKEVTGESSTGGSIQIMEELNYVDTGELKLEAENFSGLLQNIEELGTFTVPTLPVESRWTDLDVVGRTIQPKFTFGKAGARIGEFCRPWGVCSDQLGRILICDRTNHRIQIFDQFGQFITQFGSEGSTEGQFRRPTGVDVDPEGRIIIADKDNHRVQVFTARGEFIFLFGSQGSRPGQFMYPWDVASNSQANIAVSDSKNHRVQLFSQFGRLLTIFDSSVMRIENPRLSLKFLDSPRGLAFRPDGRLLVSDFNNHRLLLISPDFVRVSIIGSEGVNPGQFYRPQGVACSKTGKVAVADSKNYRIQIFDEQGNILKIFGNQGSRPGEFDCPQGLCFHGNNNVVVVDLSNNRVQVF